MVQTNAEEDLSGLLLLNYDVAESLKGKKVRDSRLVYSYGLATKLFAHAVSALHLGRNRTNLRVPGFDFDVNFVDWASIEVLARACLEALIAFNYVYLEPQTTDEAEFRFLAWMLGGFSQRESFPVQTPEGKRQIAADIKTNEAYRRRIRKTLSFQSLSGKQQKAVLFGKNWHPGRTTRGMAADIFGPIWGRSLYGFLSSHAHADALSAVQILQTAGKARPLGEAPLLVIAIVIANMSKGVASKWVAARKVYETHPQHQLNEVYVAIRHFDPALTGEGG